MKKNLFLLIVLVTLAALSGYGENLPKSQNLTTKEFAEWVKKAKNNPNIVILDVRTAEEYNSGFIEKAINIDFYSSDLQEKISKLDKNKIYLVYCRSGNRSAKFLSLMEAAGIKKAYHLASGINDWIFSGYPIKRKK